VQTTVLPVKTTGDKWMGDLAKVEGKGAFTKEVDAALLACDADLAVHRVKDVPADRPLPAGTVFAALLKRDDIRDTLIHPGGVTLDELPASTRIGAFSVRRIAQLAVYHPHLECVRMRGNANRRLEKLGAGEADGLILAVAGLERIGRRDVIKETLATDVMMPPIGGGVLALQCRQHDTELIDLVSGLCDRDTYRQTDAERMFLHVLQGHCNSPIAGYARVERGGELSLRATVFSPDGKVMNHAYEWAGHARHVRGRRPSSSERARVDRRHPALSPPRGRSGEPRLPVRGLAGTTLPRGRPSYAIGGGARRPLSVRAPK